MENSHYLCRTNKQRYRGGVARFRTRERSKVRVLLTQLNSRWEVRYLTGLISPLNWIRFPDVATNLGLSRIGRQPPLHGDPWGFDSPQFHKSLWTFKVSSMIAYWSICSTFHFGMVKTLADGVREAAHQLYSQSIKVMQ